MPTTLGGDAAYRSGCCKITTTCCEDNTNEYKMELTTDLENKQRKMMLCRKQLFYLRQFSVPLNVWVERSQTEKSPEKIERLIHDLNPCRKDLNGFDIDSLRNYNRQDVEIGEYEDKTIKKIKNQNSMNRILCAIMCAILVAGCGKDDEGTIRCTLSLPSPVLPDYVPTRSGASYQLRVVAEAYHKGTNQLADSKAVKIASTDSYTAGSDTKDAFYGTFTVDLGNEVQSHRVEMIRPFAKYRLVAKDVERYAALVANNGYPPLAEAVITVLYQGFFPSSFNVASGMPNNSAMGVKFVAKPGEVTGQAVEIASDYVLVNGSESAVTVTVVLADRNGKEYGRTTDVMVDYRRGFLTTVSGDFLTAGKMGGGITIDTEWDGEYNVEF